MKDPWSSRVGLAFVLISDTPLWPVHRDSTGEMTRGPRTCPASAASWLMMAECTD